MVANSSIAAVSRNTDDNIEQPSGGDDQRLVLSARRGDLAAFDALVRQYQRKANAVAYRVLNDVDDALEVAQDAFLKAFDKLETLDDPARFGPWLLRIVGNLALNRRRARALRKTASLDATTRDDQLSLESSLADPQAAQPDEAMQAADVSRLIQQTLDELPEMQRKALVMFSVDKMPQKDVAQALGCSVEAVKWHVFTARKKLKDRLKDYL